MVTFKLIQLYPGSKPLGYILKPVNNGLTKPDNYYQNGIWFNPSDYSKYWQEVKELTLLEEKVVEKDYEILSFISKEWCIVQLSYFTCENNFTGNDVWKIYSVKRLSDSEIFTIGDKVDFVINSNLRKDTIHKIKSIELNPNGIVFRAENSSWSNYLNEISKIKQPLFTTEDGVDIFEGNNFYSTRKDCLGSIIKYKGNSLEIASTKCKEFVDFSTKEKAEEYILMNKPLLSLSDVWDNLKIKDQKEVLKFVKSKLNK